MLRREDKATTSGLEARGTNLELRDELLDVGGPLRRSEAELRQVTADRIMS